MKTTHSLFILRQHLNYNVFNLSAQAIENILGICRKFNAGEVDLETKVMVGEEELTVAEIFEDLKIETE